MLLYPLLFFTVLADGEPDPCPDFTYNLTGMALSLSGIGTPPLSCVFKMGDILTSIPEPTCYEIQVHLGPTIAGIDPEFFREWKPVIAVDAANPHLVALDGALYTKDFSTLISYPRYGVPIRFGTDDFVSPQQTTTIGAYAFWRIWPSGASNSLTFKRLKFVDSTVNFTRNS
jgi:hypothetical protein